MAAKLTPVSSQFQVNQDIGLGQGIDLGQEDPYITALSDGRFVVVYESGVLFNESDIHGRIINANGTPSGGSFPINFPAFRNIEPAVAARSDGGFTTVRREDRTATPDIYLPLTNAAGTVTTRALLADHPACVLGDPDIATMSDGRQIVVGELFSPGDEHLWFDVVNQDGRQLFPDAVFSGFPSLVLGTY